MLGPCWKSEVVPLLLSSHQFTRELLISLQECNPWAFRLKLPSNVCMFFRLETAPTAVWLSFCHHFSGAIKVNCFMEEVDMIYSYQFSLIRFKLFLFWKAKWWFILWHERTSIAVLSLFRSKTLEPAVPFPPMDWHFSTSGSHASCLQPFVTSSKKARISDEQLATTSGVVHQHTHFFNATQNTRHGERF